MKPLKGIIIFIFGILSNAFYAQDAGCKVLYKVEDKENAYPRLSKDLKSILFQSNNKGKWQILIMDITSGKQTTVTTNQHNNNFPDWSPDNKWVAFVCDKDGNEEIYLAKADGSSQKRITTDKARDIHPYFSPDGKYILFNSTRGNQSFDVYRYSIATGETKRITDTPDNETCARYSPDMKYIVYLKNNNESDDIYTMNAAGTDPINITKKPLAQDGWPMFGPDGKWIYYSSMESGRYCIYKIKTDGSGKTQLTHSGAGEEDARVYISGNGKFIIFNKRTGITIDIRRCEKS